MSEIRARLAAAQIYAILDLGYVRIEEAPTKAGALLAAGVDVLQLRAKNYEPGAIAELGAWLAPRCRDLGVPFLINDHPALVPVAGADGVHIGQDDGPIARARAAAGPDALVGRSTHSTEQARMGWLEGADYIGFGPLHATPTKPDYAPIGLGDVADVNAAPPVPVFCIGGIKLHNLREVAAAGARRVVIVSELLEAEDCAAYVRQCREILGGFPGEGLAPTEDAPTNP